MKNYLAIVLGLMIAASSAHASRARLEALGEGKNGSYYISDNRNIFLNPAQIVKHKKKLWLELGGDTVGTPDQSAANASRGQGGFSNTFGDYTYGLFMNNTSDRALRTISNINNTTGPDDFVAPDSTLEAFFAGEGSLNWGISLFYAGNNTKTAAVEKTASLFGTRLGVAMDNLQIFTTVGIMSSSKIKNVTNDEIKGKVSVDAGITYGMDNWTWFGKFSTFGSDITAATAGPAPGTTEGRQMDAGLGFGYTKEVSKTATMFSRVEADYQKIKTTSVSDTITWNVPVVVGAEAQALSWLTFRGSVAMSILGQTATSPARNSLAGTTTVAAGMGLVFGDINIDGLIASSTGTNPANPAATGATPGFGTGPQATNNLGFGDDLLTRIAMTYNF